MKDTEILQKAIEKAVKNGYPAEFKGGFVTIPLGNTRLTCDLEGWDEGNESFHIIFDHKFAKAFWGIQEHDWNTNQPICSFCGSEGTEDLIGDTYCWKSNLKCMVLEENPLKYLEQFISLE